MPEKHPQGYRTGRDYPNAQDPPVGGLTRSPFGRDVPQNAPPSGGDKGTRSGRDHPAAKDPLGRKKKSNPYPG